MPTWPVYAAGLEQDDEVRELDGQRIGGPADLAAVLRRHRPGDHVDLVYAQRSGKAVRASITLAEDPGRRGFDVVPVESAGAALSPAQKAFRDRWLGRQ
jgi:PDZ domain-containing secreted protein